MEALEQKLGYVFCSRELLGEALNHSSYANEHRGSRILSNERLEFLALVCEQSLYEVALELNLGAYLKLGRGEEAGGGRERQSILADAVEAVFAAVYLDSDMASVSELIHRVLLDRSDKGVVEERKDYKTALQELVQREEGRTLTYQMTGESGPDHNKTFTFRVLVNGEAVGEGAGHSKKEAEQAAARDALRRFA